MGSVRYSCRKIEAPADSIRPPGMLQGRILPAAWRARYGQAVSVVADVHELAFFVKSQLRRARTQARCMHQNMAKKACLSILFRTRMAVRKSHLYSFSNELFEESGLFGVSGKDCGTLWKGCIKETYTPNSRARQGAIILSYFLSYLHLQILNISCCSVKLLSLNN